MNDGMEVWQHHRRRYSVLIARLGNLGRCRELLEAFEGFGFLKLVQQPSS